MACRKVAFFLVPPVITIVVGAVGAFLKTVTVRAVNVAAAFSADSAVVADIALAVTGAIFAHVGTIAPTAQSAGIRLIKRTYGHNAAYRSNVCFIADYNITSHSTCSAYAHKGTLSVDLCVVADNNVSAHYAVLLAINGCTAGTNTCSAVKIHSNYLRFTLDDDVTVQVVGTKACVAAGSCQNFRIILYDNASGHCARTYSRTPG